MEYTKEVVIKLVTQAYVDGYENSLKEIGLGNPRINLDGVRLAYESFRDLFDKGWDYTALENMNKELRE